MRAPPPPLLLLLLLLLPHLGRENWKRRLFILTTDGFLRYYDSKQRLLNEVDVATARFVSVEADFKFTLSVPKREFVFSAESDAQRKSWISALQRAMLEHSAAATASSPHAYASGGVERPCVLLKLTVLEWSQLQRSETRADLQEELEEVADVELVPPDKLKIAATSEWWLARHTVVESKAQAQGTQSQSAQYSSYVDWDPIVQRVRSFFSASCGDVARQGWLRKKMEFRSWKRRWVVVRKAPALQLDYYLATDTDKRRGTLNLANLIGVRQLMVGQYDVMKAEPHFVFEIENADRKVRFAAESKQELQLWIKTVEDNCRYVKTQSADSDESDGDDAMYIERRPVLEMIDPIIV